MFSFMNWYGSGVSAAGDFTLSLREWQRGYVRWVGVEVVARDLEGRSGGGAGGAWRELCVLWERVWVVRVVLAGRVDVCSSKGGDGEGDDEGEIRLLDTRHPWVQTGLRGLGALRRLEIGMEDPTVSTEAKKRFCADVQVVLDGVNVVYLPVGAEEQSKVKVGDGEREAVSENIFEGWSWTTLSENIAGGFVPAVDI